MAKFLSFAFMGGMLLVVVLTTALLQPEWGHDLALDQETWTIVERKLFGVSNRDVDTEYAMFLAHWEAKTRIGSSLIDGQLTLFEAAALFRHLKMSGSQVHRFYRGDTEDEHLCRQVIRFVEAQNAGAEFIASLEEELRRHKELHGTVILPDVVAPEDSALDQSGHCSR